MRRFCKENRGGVAPLIAILSSALVVIFISMLLGLAQLRLYRQEIYRAADLAAIAGAQQLDFAHLIQGELRLEPSAQAIARETLMHNLEHIEKTSGISHRVPWKQGILRLAKVFF